MCLVLAVNEFEVVKLMHFDRVTLYMATVIVLVIIDSDRYYKHWNEWNDSQLCQLGNSIPILFTEYYLAHNTNTALDYDISSRPSMIANTFSCRRFYKLCMSVRVHVRSLVPTTW